LATRSAESELCRGQPCEFRCPDRRLAAGPLVKRRRERLAYRRLDQFWSFLDTPYSAPVLALRWRHGCQRRQLRGTRLRGRSGWGREDRGIWWPCSSAVIAVVRYSAALEAAGLAEGEEPFDDPVAGGGLGPTQSPATCASRR
jgi:hypothetical protein